MPRTNIIGGDIGEERSPTTSNKSISYMLVMILSSVLILTAGHEDIMEKQEIN